MVLNQKGNRGGFRAGAGRKKKHSRIINEALEQREENFPVMFAIAEDMAMGKSKVVECPQCKREFTVYHCQPDKDLLIYMINRRLGKPVQSIDQRTTTLIVTPDDYELATRLTLATEAKVLQDYSSTLLNGGITHGQDSEGQNEALP